jgi:hypothetical protein
MYKKNKTGHKNGEHEEPLIIFAKATMIEIGQHTMPSSTCYPGRWASSG